MFAPHVSLCYARAGMLSADGRCKAFDSRANGYVRGEGLGVFLLVTADCSLASPDRSLTPTLLVGSSVRQDGYSASLTAPNGESQAKLVAEALRRASLDRR